MKVVYIAGPFRGPDAWAIRCNVARAEELSMEVAKLGAMPLVPHKNTESMHGALPDEFFLEGTLELMRRCDAVLLTDDWERSSGARTEVAEAHRLGIPCFCGAKKLRHWLTNVPMPGVREEERCAWTDLAGFSRCRYRAGHDGPHRMVHFDDGNEYALIPPMARAPGEAVGIHRLDAADAEREALEAPDLDGLRAERDQLARDVEAHAGGDRPSSPAASKLRRLAELDAQLQGAWLDGKLEGARR